MLNLMNILFSDVVLKLLIFSCGFACIYFFVQYILPDEKQAEVRRRLAMTEETSSPQQTALLRWFKPLYSAVSPFLYSTSIPSYFIRYFEAQKTPIHKKLVAANLRSEISPDEFLGLKVVMSFFLFVVIFAIILSWYLCKTGTRVSTFQRFFGLE